MHRGATFANAARWSGDESAEDELGLATKDDEPDPSQYGCEMCDLGRGTTD